MFPLGAVAKVSGGKVKRQASFKVINKSHAIYS